MNFKWIVVNQLVLRIDDNANIPADPANLDWIAFQEWVTAGGVPLPADPFPVTGPDADSLAAKAYPKLAALMAMTPAQVIAWVDAGNVNTGAERTDAIKTLMVAICVLARRL